MSADREPTSDTRCEQCIELWHAGWTIGAIATEHAKTHAKTHAADREPTSTETQPCPFCGGPAYATRTVNGTQMFHVGCAACGVEFKAAWYRDANEPTKDVVGAWNRRVPKTPVVYFPESTSDAEQQEFLAEIERQYGDRPASSPNDSDWLR